MVYRTDAGTTYLISYMARLWAQARGWLSGWLCAGNLGATGTSLCNDAQNWSGAHIFSRCTYLEPRGNRGSSCRVGGFGHPRSQRQRRLDWMVDTLVRSN